MSFASKMLAAGKAYKKMDDVLQKGLIATAKERFKKGKAPKLSTSKELVKYDPKKALPAKFKAVKKIGKLARVARVARALTPVGIAYEGARVAYDIATLPAATKAKIKAKKAKLRKTSTMSYHKDLATGYNKGGVNMLKGKQKKLDKDGDGKISGNDFKMMKKAKVGKMINDTEELGRVDSEKAYTKKGKKNLKDEKKRLVSEVKKDKKKMFKANQGRMLLIKKLKGAQVGPTEEKKLGKMSNQDLRDKLREKKMMKANQGAMVSTRGFGAARTSGSGLEDESLQPGKMYVVKGGGYIDDLL